MVFVLQPRLDLRQSQTLVMTPQLQQAIKLLQLSNLELSSFVEQELERNPLLERDETRPDRLDREAERAEDSRRDAGEAVVVEAVANSGETPLDVEVDNSFDAASYDPDAPGVDVVGALASGGGGGSGGGSGFEDDGRSLEETLTQRLTLRDHLADQIAMDLPAPADRLVATALADSLDPAGYLVADLDDLAEGLGTTRAHVERVLACCQRFDPAGLFARSLRECLALQLQDRNRYDPAIAALLDNLPLLARRDFDGLRRVCGVDDEDLREMIAEIRHLDPKPALLFEGEAAAPVVPDVLMRRNPDSEKAQDDEETPLWIVELNPDTLPRVLVNNRYYAKVSRASQSKEDRSFLSENWQTATWLVKSLDQRAQTILKVSAEIVRQQAEFFEKGIRGLRPLILRDIASAIEMHESTVSRVTSNKYIATPRGIFELKYFFTQAIAGSDGGEAHSAEMVRHRIKELIDAEPANATLSDDALVKILKAEQIDIARRTVAKYRESMKIASSVQRRREKMSTAAMQAPS